MDAIKILLGCITLVIIVALMGAFPTVAVAITAIAIVGLFLLGKG